MIPAPAGLQTMLTSRNVYVVADLFSIGALRVTTWPGGIAPFVSDGYVVRAGNFRTVAAMEDPTFRVSLVVGAQHSSVLVDAANGVFDGLEFKAQRTYMEPPGGTADLVITRFVGTIVQAIPSLSEVTFVASSALGAIKVRKIGRLMQANCPWTYKDQATCRYPTNGIYVNTPCNKSLSDCVTRANVANFGGFPYAPIPRITGPSL